MKKKNRLKLNKDFRRLYSKGKSHASGSVVIYALKKKSENIRVGITVGKNVGNAVSRNRAKRIIRAGFDVVFPKVQPGYDFIIVARTRIIGKKTSQIARDIEVALCSLNLLIEDSHPVK